MRRTIQSSIVLRLCILATFFLLNDIEKVLLSSSVMKTAEWIHRSNMMEGSQSNSGNMSSPFLISYISDIITKLPHILVLALFVLLEFLSSIILANLTNQNHLFNPFTILTALKMSESTISTFILLLSLYLYQKKGLFLFVVVSAIYISIGTICLMTALPILISIQDPSLLNSILLIKELINSQDDAYSSHRHLHTGTRFVEINDNPFWGVYYFLPKQYMSFFPAIFNLYYLIVSTSCALALNHSLIHSITVSLGISFIFSSKAELYVFGTFLGLAVSSAWNVNTGLSSLVLFMLFLSYPFTFDKWAAHTENGVFFFFWQIIIVGISSYIITIILSRNKVLF
eukprot:GHVP01032653.1.p1 GENE.GHVP01032653.1~~GHVP01032653.1.p1  ORF type:complete len:342 (+),score=16.32 GHVP01032653.1:1291-2316(+)